MAHSVIRRLIFTALYALLTIFILRQDFTTWALLKTFEQGGSHWEETEEQAPNSILPSPHSTIHWQDRGSGVATTEIPIVIEGEQVDQIYLTRFDPKYIEFAVHIDRAAYRDIDEWRDSLAALAVINGSYYGIDGLPSTPVRSFGQNFGPNSYQANHGAFITDRNSAAILDLNGLAWRDEIGGYPHAMVSFPLLVAHGKSGRVAGNDKWTANRSFIAIDSQRMILWGTTAAGFFSLRRLSTFLVQLPLSIDFALNLDGGPIAGQAIQMEGYRRSIYGTSEIATDAAGNVRILRPGNKGKKWPLPIVLAAFKK